MAFLLSTFFPNTIFMIAATVCGGLLGFYVTSKKLIGKQIHSFDYKDIVCLIPAVPYFTIVHDDQKLFELRMLDKVQRKVLNAIKDATSVGMFIFEEKHGKYYFTPKEQSESTEETQELSN